MVITNGSDSHGDGDTIPEDLEEDYFPPSPIDGEVSEGHANRILEVVEEDYFPPNFNEYMLKEQLKWWRYTGVFTHYYYFKWVFWSEQDRQIEQSLSLDNGADFSANKVEYNVRHALEKLISFNHLGSSLIQFWAPTKTSEGRTLFTTQYQPFALALGRTSSKFERQQLCEYRMKMCSSEYNNYFYADGQSGEEQLGLLGRVFLHQLPESTPDVKYYSEKEYPQLDLALRCKIAGSWAVPVFEHSSPTCVGVLEMVSHLTHSHDSLFVFSLHDLQKNLQEFGLQCFNGNQDCMLGVNLYQVREDEYWKKAERVEGLTHACQELRTVLRSVCQFHKLPLAMTWVPCSACDGLRPLKVKFCSGRSRYRGMFLQVCQWSHLRKGLVFGRALSSPNMLYCSNISKLSLGEYPLVPYARLCKFSGWFTICLQNVYTGNDIYVLEFFLPTRSKDSENMLTTLSLILGTMENNFKTFRLASGKELGEEMSFEVLHFQNNQRFQSVQRIQATRDFSVSSIPSSVQSCSSVAYTGPGFQGANMGTIKAKYDPNSNPFSNFDLSFDSDSDPSFEQSSTSVANTRPGFQNSNMVIIIAEYASIEKVFELSLPCRLVELQQEVTKRLMLEAGNYSVTYEDEEDGPVLINCDEDLQTYVDDSMSQGDTPRVVLLELKEPATNLNPTN